MKIVKNIQKLSHEIVVYAKDGRKSHLTLHWSAENVKIDKTNFSLRNTIPLHGMNKTNDERCYTAAVWTQISISPLQVRGALSGGWVGCLCQWELKAPTDRSRSDCVHEQVAKRIANVRFTFYMVEYVEVILVLTVEIFRMFPIPEFLDMNFQPALLRRMKMNMESNREWS